MKSTLSKIKTEIHVKFNDSIIIRKEDLYALVQKYSPEATYSTLKWYVHKLKKDNIVRSIRRGVYVLYSDKKDYDPDIDYKLKKISRLIKGKYKDIVFCIWNSNWLNEFSRHQANTNIVIIDAERDFLKSIYNILIDNSIKNIYLEPNKNITETYIAEQQSAIIIKTIVTKSPLVKRVGVYTPTLEKILVDLFTDDLYLEAYKGFEQSVIFNNAFENYNINIMNMLNYSRRNEKYKSLVRFLINEVNLKKELFYD